jgi:hypothetical protein
LADKKKSPVLMKDKASKNKAKTKAKKGVNPFAQKGGMKPPKPMNPGAGAMPPMLGM